MAGRDSDDYAVLRDLFENAPVPYQSLDPEGRFLRVNRAFTDLLGYSESELLGRPFADILAPESRDVLPGRFAAFKSSGRVQRAEFLLVRKDGSEVPVELNGTIGVGVDGSIERTHCVFMDVSDRLFAERRLRAGEQRYRSLVEMAHEGIWHIDRDARTVFANASMASMLGYKPDEMVGRHLFEFMDEDGRLVAQENLRRREQGIAEEHDFEFMRRDGRRIYAAVATRPLIDEHGDYNGAIAGIIDMTAQREMNQRLLYAQKLDGLETMAGGIAHDFNNLLQTILGNAELAQVDGPLPPEVGRALAAIEKAAHQAADLCRQMLAYAGRGVYAMRPVHVDELVTDIEALLRATVTRKADLRFNLAADLPAVQGDPAQLRQVLVNLVSNAAEALEGAAGAIDVKVGEHRLDAEAAANLFGEGGPGKGRYVTLSVRDSGCGIDPETLGSIFDPFFSTKFAGRGLGLAVVRGVALAHGGAVTVDSTPGHGTCFEVWIPVAAAGRQPVEAVAALAQAASAGGDRRSILVADDDEQLLDMVVRMIDRLGWDAVGVADGAAAVATLAEEPDRFALVVLDWSMPVMDGREALEAIRLTAPALPVFMSSGHAVDALAAEVEHLHPTGFLAKPYRLAELRRVLAALAAPAGGGA